MKREVSFEDYGVRGPETAADDALERMLADPEIRVIHGYTDLNFTQRHKLHRGHVLLDFHGCLVTAAGIERARHNDPFGAVMHFAGVPTGERRELVTEEPLKEQYDIFPVPDADLFPVYSWWQVAVNALEGREEKEIDKLLMVTERIDDTHVRFNYKMGWPLEKGRRLTYTGIRPVEDVVIQNMAFDGNPGGEDVGASPVALEYAVNCNVYDIRARHTYWPVVIRRHNTEFRTEGCRLVNPTEVVVGGTGYLTQQIHCLYGAVRDCAVSNARHLNDFTGCAYCMVENCHGDGDFHGAFVTHGQFEHDLTYVGNSGLLSFANSGPTWGSSAKRITVLRHVGCWGLGFAKVSDLTIQDGTFLQTEKYEECGTMLMNADGLQLRGCSARKLVLTQRSTRSRRPCVVEDCYFQEGVEVVKDGDAPVTNEVILRNITTDADSAGKGDAYEE